MRQWIIVCFVLAICCCVVSSASLGSVTEEIPKDTALTGLVRKIRGTEIGSSDLLRLKLRQRERAIKRAQRQKHFRSEKEHNFKSYLHIY